MRNLSLLEISADCQRIVRNFELYDAYIASRRYASDRLSPGADSLCNAVWLMWHALSKRSEYRS